MSNKAENKKGGTVINNNFVVNLKEGEVRESRFTFGPYQDMIIDSWNLGRYSIFRTVGTEEDKIVPSPIYYVDNET